MTIKQTVKIPASRRVSLVFPKDIPTGSAEIELKIIKFPESKPRQRDMNSKAGSQSATPRSDRLLGILAPTDKTLDDFRTERLRRSIPLTIL